MIYPDDLPLVQLLKLYHDMPKNIGTTARILGAEMGVNSPCEHPISAILVSKTESNFVSDGYTDICPNCNMPCDLEGAPICYECMLVALEPAPVCEHCGGSGEIWVERHTYAGIDWEAGTTRPCPDCENGQLVRDGNGREDWRAHVSYAGKKVWS